MFAAAVAAAGLGSLCLVPHCARLGGANEDYAASARALPDIQRHGRRLFTKSVSRYEKSRKLRRQLGRMTDGQVASAEAFQIRLLLVLPASLNHV